MKATRKKEVMTAATAPAPAPAPAIRKFSLSGFAAAPVSGKAVKTYPLLPDHDGTAAELADAILDAAERVEALEGALALQKAELIALAKPFYFTHHAGQLAVASAIEVRGASGNPVRVGFSNSYRAVTDEPALMSLAGEHAARFFKQAFELKVKGDLIPEASAEALLGELQELFARHNASSAVSVKATIKPTKEFHVARHTLFTPEQNVALDRICPIGGSVKTKLGGRDDE